MDGLSRADMVLSKKKKGGASSSCCDVTASAMSVEACVVRLCTESRLFPCVGDCAERCVNCAKGSKQLRGRARAQPRGNIVCKPVIIIFLVAIITQSAAKVTPFLYFLRMKLFIYK